MTSDLCLCQLRAFGAGGRAEGWPGLLHSANSSQLRVWLQGVGPRAEHARFLLELQGLGHAPHGLRRVEVHRSIDDEYTPSIFTVRTEDRLTEDILIEDRLTTLLVSD